jgi:hypothetical protein
MFMFGRAALLGATMRDPYRCYRSFPECPRDPDRLVDYLNNHNGGFFKMFDQGAQGSTANPDSGYPTRRPYYSRSDKKFRKGVSTPGIYHSELNQIFAIRGPHKNYFREYCAVTCAFSVNPRQKESKLQIGVGARARPTHT